MLMTIIPKKNKCVCVGGGMNGRVRKTVSDQVGSVLPKMLGPQISGSWKVFHLSPKIRCSLSGRGDFRPPQCSGAWESPLMVSYKVSVQGLPSCCGRTFSGGAHTLHL